MFNAWRVVPINPDFVFGPVRICQVCHPTNTEYVIETRLFDDNLVISAIQRHRIPSIVVDCVERDLSVGTGRDGLVGREAGPNPNICAVYTLSTYHSRHR